MKWLFSKRHAKAIKEKKYPLTLSMPLRRSILKLLRQYSNYFDYGGIQEENITEPNAEEKLKLVLGINEIKAFNPNNEYIPLTFENIFNGGHPSKVFDAIEAWFDQGPQRAEMCESELNDIFAMNGSPWRILNGNVILINSDYLYSEVQNNTLKLLGNIEALGAEEEFQKAIQALQSGDTKSAVINAHNSIESLIKFIFGSDNGHADIDKLSLNKLIDLLLKTGIIPKYYESFFKNFKELILGVAKERNRGGRAHGQGAEVQEVPETLAIFVLNLAGSINYFLIQSWTEHQTEPGPEKVSNTTDIKDYIPF